MKLSKKKRKEITAKRVAKEQAEAKKNKPVSNVRNYTITDTSVYTEPRKFKVCPKTYIVKAAIKDKETGEIFSLYSNSAHCEISSHFFRFRETKMIDGFVDNHGNFYNRVDAAKVAYEAGQCSDLYLQNGLISTGFKYINPEDYPEK